VCRKVGSGGLGNAARKYVVSRSGGMMSSERVRHWKGLLDTIVVVLVE
jgi:hypothetical protein